MDGPHVGSPGVGAERQGTRPRGIRPIALAAPRILNEPILGTGVLIANPIPVSDELPAETYDQALETALSDAELARALV